jgi:flavin reductase (DIM6/NTAB) family NADH-FMN oxidoreductase RutF
MSEADRGKSWPAALGRVPSGLFVLTARRGNEEAGMLASFVQQCSFDPPLVSAAIRRGRTFETWLRSGDSLVINILDDGQTDMVAFFGRGVDPGPSPFANLELERTADGTAILAEVLAFLECKVESSVTTGDHELLILRVVEGRLLGEGKPMVHIRKNGLHY